VIALQEVSHGSPGLMSTSLGLPSMTFTDHCPDPPCDYQALLVLTGMIPKQRCSHPGQHRDLDQRATMAPRIAIDPEPHIIRGTCPCLDTLCHLLFASRAESTLVAHVMRVARCCGEPRTAQHREQCCLWGTDHSERVIIHRTFARRGRRRYCGPVRQGLHSASKLEAAHVTVSVHDLWTSGSDE